MRRRVTYRPSKAQGTFSLIFGVIFVLIGLFVVIPVFGPFGILWTLIAAVGTGMDAYRTFGNKYVGPEIRIEDGEQAGARPASPPPAEDHDHIPSTALDPKHRLEQLKTLREAGLIDDREYQEKRKDILRDL